MSTTIIWVVIHFRQFPLFANYPLLHEKTDIKRFFYCMSLKIPFKTRWKAQEIFRNILLGN